MERLTPLHSHTQSVAKPIILTMIYNVGLRNMSVGLVLALTYFPPAVAIPITLFILFQQPLAAAVPLLFRCDASVPRHDHVSM